MFDPLLYNLRGQGIKVGMNEWLAFVDALKLGLAHDLDSLYALARAVLIHSQADYDAYDLAFAATFKGLAIDPRLTKALEDWLANPKMFEEGRAPGEHEFESLQALMEALAKTLAEQKERHDGGNRWVGTGGTSPFGHGGAANMGVRVGGSGGGPSSANRDHSSAASAPRLRRK